MGWAEGHCTARSCCRPVRLAVAHAACELPTVGQVRCARGQSQRSAGVQREREREPAFRSRDQYREPNRPVTRTYRTGARRRWRSHGRSTGCRATLTTCVRYSCRVRRKKSVSILFSIFFNILSIGTLWDIASAVARGRANSQLPCAVRTGRERARASCCAGLCGGTPAEGT